MALAPIAVTYLPVLVWVGIGFGLLAAYRRSTSATVLRLAAAFLASWAVLATTALLWVLSNGGFRGIERLIASPLSLFDGQFLVLWLLGAAGAFAVFLVAFVVSQAVARGILRLVVARPLPWPTTLAARPASVALYEFPSARPDAFTFTVLERGRGLRLFRRDVILVSEGLLERLTTEEWEAVVAHELGHIRELDGRYLTFIRMLSRMMRWDPFFALLSASLTRREEYRADLDAVELTRRPRALARALFKAGLAGGRSRYPGPVALLGVRGRRGRRETVERIRRLVALAESGEYPEEPVG